MPVSLVTSSSTKQNVEVKVDELFWKLHFVALRKAYKIMCLDWPTCHLIMIVLIFPRAYSFRR